jgi:hypothetical protein
MPGDPRLNKLPGVPPCLVPPAAYELTGLAIPLARPPPGFENTRMK